MVLNRWFIQLPAKYFLKVLALSKQFLAVSFQLVLCNKPANSTWLAGAKFGLALPISLMFNDTEETISTADKLH